MHPLLVGSRPARGGQALWGSHTQWHAEGGGVHDVPWSFYDDLQKVRVCHSRVETVAVDEALVRFVYSESQRDKYRFTQIHRLSPVFLAQLLGVQRVTSAVPRAREQPASCCRDGVCSILAGLDVSPRAPVRRSQHDTTSTYSSLSTFDVSESKTRLGREERPRSSSGVQG